MKCIEVIIVRSLEKNNRQLVGELLWEVFKQKESPLPAAIRVYSHNIVETDLSIHIHWEIEGQNPSESPLGQRICSALKRLGLLNHSVWVETAALEFPYGYARSEAFLSSERKATSKT